MDIKQLENAKIAFNKNKKSNNRYNRVIHLFLFIGSYLFFFSSPMWYDDVSDFKPATKMNTSKSWSNRDVQLLNWDYDKSQRKMEIKLLITNKSYDGIENYKITALDKSKGFITTEEIVNKDGFYVIHLKDVPKKWSQISLRINLPNDDTTTCKFYTNKVSVSEVDSIKDLTYNQYMIIRLESYISNYEDEIRNLENDITEQTAIINNCKEDIKKYKENETFQTELEKKETQRLISDAQGKINTSKTAIESDNNNIKEYKERIELTKKQMKTYK